MNIFLTISILFLGTLLIGKLLEKIRVPWIFAALLIGAGLAVYNPISTITSSASFELFAQLGMYFLLFLVGFELDTEKLKKRKGFIFRSAFFIILLEGLIGSLIVHSVFGYDWVVSLLVSLSFATVGEAILIPILHEFGLTNTRLGQSIIGIGAADDIIEIVLLLSTSVLVGTSDGEQLLPILISLGALVLLTTGFQFFGKESHRFQFVSIETLFIFILSIFFLFIGIGSYAAAAPLAAILAGVTVRLFIHNKRLSFVESELRSITYGFFAPLFFVWIGSSLDIQYLVASPLLILLVVFVSNGTKLIGSYLMGAKELGTKGSLLLGVGLSVRFSTSIIIMKYLFDNQIIGYDIYSVVIASSILFQFIIPIAFSWLVVHWKRAIT